MTTDKRSNEERNITMDKTYKDQLAGDPYANQGGGKIASGNVNSGHPANDVIVKSPQHAQDDTARARASAKVSPGPVHEGEEGDKGSGTPVVSGAGMLLDDRPGRNDPKGKRPG